MAPFPSLMCGCRALAETELGGESPRVAKPAHPESIFLLGTVRAPGFGTRTRVCLTWATSEQESWQCSMRGTQAFFTSSLKKCFLEILTTFASFPKRRKAFKRSCSLSCDQDTQTSSETRGARSPAKPQPFSMDLFKCHDPCKAFWTIPSGRSLSCRAPRPGITGYL